MPYLPARPVPMGCAAARGGWRWQIGGGLAADSCAWQAREARIAIR